MQWYYTSDSHLFHEAILGHCQRPFASGDEMTEAIWGHLLEVDRTGGSIVHAGDFALHRGLERLLANPDRRFDGAARHHLLLGNHEGWGEDPVVAEAVRRRFFGTLHTASSAIFEDEVDGRAVRVLLSHRPMRLVEGVDFNVYGHLHNNLQRKSQKHREDFWVEGSLQHFNACVEMTGYRPMTLQEMADRRRAGVFQW